MLQLLMQLTILILAIPVMLRSLSTLVNTGSGTTLVLLAISYYQYNMLSTILEGF